MRILFLSRWYPRPADNGSKIRIANLLRGICQGHEVTLLSFVGVGEGDAAQRQPFEGPREIRTCEFREFNPRSFRALSGFLSPAPRFLIDTYSTTMEGMIRQAVRNTEFDLVIASQLSMASYSRAFQGIPAILEEVELASYWPPQDRAVASGPTLRRRITWAKHRRYIAGLLRNFRLCTVASEAERKLVSAAAPGYTPIHVVPNFIDAGQYRPVPGPRGKESLVFTGSLRFAPNHDAVTWFVQDIFPLIREKVAGAQLTVTGDPGPLPPIGPGVVFAGKLDQVQTVLGSSAVSVVPIRQGGGTRLKILEAMAMGTPIVTTSKGVEGIEARNGEHLLIADTSDQFAEATTRLLLDPAYARNLAEAALKLVQSQYDSRSVMPAFLGLIDEAAPAAASGSPAETTLHRCSVQR
jgi:glycosyltransferase involved in cell wall biosynthesis